jgi:flagellar basal body rod protein FlgC
MSHKKNITKEAIEREYLTVARNLDEAATALNVSKKTLLFYMKKLGIESKSHSWNASSRDLSSLAKKQYIDVEIIKSEYLEKPVGMFIAAKGIGCSVAFLRKSIVFHKMKSKNKSWNPERTRIAPQLNDKEWLIEQKKTKSHQQIANDLGTTQGNVAYYASKHGLSLSEDEQSKATIIGLNKRYPEGRRGSLSPNWRGGRRRVGTDKAYICIYSPNHPHATKEGYVMEHRLVMEKYLGRILEHKEIVHHINGDKKDNRIENLELISGGHGEHTRNHFNDSFKLKGVETENDRLRKLVIELGGNPDEQKPIE